ncbi:MAG: HU family DNA-binding protein [Anaerolineae bacterium]|nr:HU family DNA-binding protein [Anaerolineae bacterium]
MHKRELIDEVARRTGFYKDRQRGLTRRQVKEALDLIMDVITDELAAGHAVTIAGFGRFEAKEHAGRRVVGLGGEEYQVEARLVPSFHPYDSLRDKVTAKSAARFKREGHVPLFWSRDPNS